MDLALVVVMLPALEQLVLDAIARLEHASSLAGQLDPRLLDSRELRLFVEPWCHCRSVRAYYCARSRSRPRLREDGALHHHRDLASSPFNENNG
jgi:hypothetical protein